jgi:hypothetical protein
VKKGRDTSATLPVPQGSTDGVAACDVTSQGFDVIDVDDETASATQGSLAIAPVVSPTIS